MERVVYIFGTDHRFQFRDPNFSTDQHALFLRTLGEKAKRLDVALVAEECNPESLAEKNCASSTVRDLALEIGLAHSYCDPDRKQRADLSIRQENEIRLQAFFDDKEDDEEWIQEQVQASFKLRESFWAEQILTQGRWPVLFVCGANHVESFRNVLLSYQIHGVIEESDWGA